MLGVSTGRMNAKSDVSLYDMLGGGFTAPDIKGQCSSRTNRTKLSRVSCNNRLCEKETAGKKSFSTCSRNGAQRVT